MQPDTGDVYTWGRSTLGQTGHGFRNAKARTRAGLGNSFQGVPRFVTALIGVPVASVAAGPDFAVAITRKGQVWSWGEGRAGQLGIGKAVAQRDIPQLVMEADPDDGTCIVQLACGWGHVIARSGALCVGLWLPRFLSASLM